MRSLSTAWNGAPFPITPAQITAVIEHQNYTPVISPRFKLLDYHTLIPAHTGVYGPLANDDGDISSHVLTAKIANDDSLATPRTLDITFKDDFSYNALTQGIQVFMDYYDPVTRQLLFEVPLGIFRYALPTKTIADSGVTSQATMGDLTSLLQTKFMNTFVMPAGITFVQAMIWLLTLPNLPASQFNGGGVTPSGMDCIGPGFPANRVSIVDNGQVLAAPIPFTRDQTFRDALDILAAAINYYPVWIDGVGVLQSSAKPNLSQVIPPTTWSYVTDETSIIHPAGVTWTPAVIDSLANVVVFYAENNSTQTFYSVKYNDKNKTSSLCISTLGFCLPPLILRDDNCPDQNTADAHAYIALTDAARLAETVQIVTWPNPFMTDSHERCAVTITDINGNVLLTNADGWEESAWSIDLNTRQHTRQIGRIVFV